MEFNNNKYQIDKNKIGRCKKRHPISYNLNNAS